MKTPVPAIRPTVGARFRSEIEQALSEGVPIEDIELQLTLGDAEQLKRDRAVAVSDISFTDGVMTYLGVKVSALKAAKGEVVVSALRRRVAEKA